MRKGRQYGSKEDGGKYMSILSGQKTCDIISIQGALLIWKVNCFMVLDHMLLVLGTFLMMLVHRLGCGFPGHRKAA